MQLISMITMLIDHIGFIFFPDEAMWRIIGRVAFPFYAYGIVMGYKYTSNLQKYMLRLLLLAIIAQVPFMLAFQYITLNVIFTLLISLLIITLLDKIKNIRLGVSILILCIVIMELIPMDYGAYGLLLVIIYRYASSNQIIVMHFCLNLIFFFYRGWDIQMISLLSTIKIMMHPQIAEMGRKVTPVWLWRSFYPAHLLVLAIISYLI